MGGIWDAEPPYDREGLIGAALGRSDDALNTPSGRMGMASDSTHPSHHRLQTAIIPVLEEGMVFTIEPRPMMPETNDMRRRMMVHEEDVVVTQNGCDSLSLRAADILPIV